jgi:hypothetical protein
MTEVVDGRLRGTVDPLASLRMDITAVDPLTRARVAMEAAELAEARQAEARREERQAEAETRLHEMLARQRVEKFRQGYTSEELEADRLEREQVRRAKLDDLWQQIERLDPAFAAVKRAEAQQVARAADADAVLARARSITSDPYMRGQLIRYHERRAGMVSRECAADFRVY